MKREVIEGKLQGNERGYAFLIPINEGEEDYFIPHSDLRGALHGDIVLAEKTRGEGARTTARVLKILERGVKQVVGTYFSHKTGGFVVPDDKKYFNDVFVPFSVGLRAKSGDKVVAKILSYPKNKNPEGMIVKILGRQFDKNAELKSIIYSYDLPEKFPKKVLERVKEYPTFCQDDLKNRNDFRNLLTMTIDGEDARDFDDAISIEKLENGNYKLGVHIADVSFYVKQGDPVDLEAFNRGTSVYFPESVIPMLPERLCNDLCSLKENQDRPTLSCIMTVDKKGVIIDYEICPSVIKSRARMTYTNVQKILDKDKKTTEKYKDLTAQIFLMEELADILIKKREKDGSVDLDVKESQIIVDKKGEIIVSATKKDKAHGLIEEFMILANCTVAEYMYFLEKPFIYRVHGEPTEERLENFYDFLKGIGINAKRKKEGIYPKDFQLILKNAKDKATFTLINRVMLRTMQKAKYSAVDIGHFGLSLKHYCHFTSPIRRYPDLIVHRIIKDFLALKENIKEKYGEFVFTASTKASEREKIAIEVERAVDDYYKLLYISGFVGEEFDGVISGVTNFGVFVELNNAIEGIVKIENLPSKKRLVLDAKNYLLSDGKTIYKLGQKVRIKVAGINVGDKRAEFLLLE